ncbi:MAG: RDD family protein, partial [Candidatus Limnocylindrales bacterium]
MAPGLVYADVASRLVAFILDLFIVGLLTSLLATVLGMRPDLVSIDGLQAVSLGFDYSILSVVVGLIYFVASWSGGRRATLGQRLFRLQVGNAGDGRPLTLEQAVRRWLGYGHFLVLFSFEASIASVANLVQL